jgi:hypothetical protein
MSKCAYNASFNPKNIKSSFRSTGIYPFNRLVYGETDFVASYVTDLPEPEVLVAEAVEVMEPLIVKNGKQVFSNVETEMMIFYNFQKDFCFLIWCDHSRNWSKNDRQTEKN